MLTIHSTEFVSVRPTADRFLSYVRHIQPDTIWISVRLRFCEMALLFIAEAYNLDECSRFLDPSRNLGTPATFNRISGTNATYPGVTQSLWCEAAILITTHS